MQPVYIAVNCEIINTGLWAFHSWHCSSASLIGHCYQAPHSVLFFVSSTRVTLLYVVDLAIALAAISIGRIGIVRLTGREPTDQVRSRLSRGELTPFSKRGSAVLLEDIAVVEVAVLVEVVVDRGMYGGKLLKSFYIPEERHCPLSSPERLV